MESNGLIICDSWPEREPFREKVTPARAPTAHETELILRPQIILTVLSSGATMTRFTQ